MKNSCSQPTLATTLGSSKPRFLRRRFPWLSIADCERTKVVGDGWMMVMMTGDGQGYSRLCYMGTGYATRARGNARGEERRENLKMVGCGGWVGKRREVEKGSDMLCKD